MNKVYELIDYRPFPNSQLNKKLSLSSYIQNDLNKKISRLNEINRIHGENEFKPKTEEFAKIIYKKFREAYSTNSVSSHSFNSRDLKRLSYILDFSEQGISIYNDPESLKYCLKLLETKWKPSFILGLFRTYLSNWSSSSSTNNSVALLNNFLSDKLKSYQGSRSSLKSIKKHFAYYHLNGGDLSLGYTLAAKDKPPTEVTKFLSVPDSWITYPYFSGVILGYVYKIKRNLKNHLKEIFEFLELHTGKTNTPLSKLVLSKIICEVDSKFPEFKDLVKDKALELIGDPAKGNNWRIAPEYSEKDNKTILQAKELLNTWIITQFISVFFEVCINDTRRKNFWLRYSKNITEFKVYGSRYTKKLLSRDERISGFVNHRFSVLDTTQDKSAFTFKISKYEFVEFSDPGYAFYAFKVNNPKAPSNKKYNIDSIGDFRDGSMPYLVYRNGMQLYNFSNEGRMSHNDGYLTWEYAFKTWIKKYTGINAWMELRR